MSDAPVELGGYQVEQELGEGGMARVYRAYDAGFDRYVALKILKPASGRIRRWLRAFSRRRATRAPSRIRTSFASTGSRRSRSRSSTWSWSKDRRSARGLRSAGGKLPWQEAVKIARDLASALEHAHRLGRVHRDVKPGNILMADEGRTPKLVDFGIAMIDRPEATRLTRHGEMVGTPRYMSPEQVRGEPVDGRTDLYSLGAVLYEMLTGSPATRATASSRSLRRSSPAHRFRCGSWFQICRPMSSPSPSG